MVNDGYYFFGAVNLYKELAVDNRRLIARRDCLRSFSVLEYECVQSGNIWFFLNRFGTVCILYKNHNCHSRSQLESIYESEYYTSAYAEILSGIKTITGIEVKDLDWIGKLCIGEKFKVSWDEVCTEAKFDFTVMLDAIFTYQTTLLLEKEIRRLNSFNVTKEEILQVKEIAHEMFFLRNARNVRVQTNDIAALETFYTSWEVAKLIDFQHEYFMTSIEKYSFYLQFMERGKMDLMNMLLFCISILGVFDIADMFSYIGIEDKRILSIALFSLTAVIVVPKSLKLLRERFFKHKEVPCPILRLSEIADEKSDQKAA